MIDVHEILTEDEGERLDELWRRESPALMRYATALVGPHDAHDIAVNAFIRATRSVAFATAASERGLLLSAVLTEARNLRRQRTRRWRRDIAAIGEQSVGAWETHTDLYRAMSLLSVQQRSVLFLAYWEDMTEAVIAESLGLSTGTVHRNLDRARTALRKALQ